MSILVSGTLAVDHIARVADGFQTGDLNGKLEQPAAHWGGCGMNLSYALMRSGYDALPWIFYGQNLPAGYQTHIDDLGLNRLALVAQPDASCAEAFIFSRANGSQLTGFYPGSTAFHPPTAEQQDAIKNCDHWIAGPEDDATLLARLSFINPATQLYWMPGQYVDVTRNNVLAPMLARKPNLVVNETEWQTLQRNVGDNALNAALGAVFVTRGDAGVLWRKNSASAWQEQSTQPAEVVDPTGCGDAFCGTLVGGIAQGLPIEQALNKAQSNAAACLGQTGAQHY